MAMDKLQLTGPNLGRVFSNWSGRVCATLSCCFWAKLPNLKLKSRTKQLLDSLPFRPFLNIKICGLFKFLRWFCWTRFNWFIINSFGVDGIKFFILPLMLKNTTAYSGYPYWGGRLSTVDFFVQTSLNQTLFILGNISYFSYKTSYLNEEVKCTEPSPFVSFPWLGGVEKFYNIDVSYEVSLWTTCDVKKISNMKNNEGSYQD